MPPVLIPAPQPLRERLGSDESDIFISYSHADEAFARTLYRQLEKYRPPRSVNAPRRTLRVFRYTADMTGTVLEEAIRQHLDRSSRLVVLCSPAARQSTHVDGEIHYFAETRGPESIIPLLIRGMPNAEAEEPGRSFSETLMEVKLGNPLAVDYRGFDPARDRCHRGRFRPKWFQLLANIYGLNQRELEQREKARARRRFFVGLIVAALAAAAAGSGFLYTRTDAYQVSRVIHDGNAIAGRARQSTQSWYDALVASGRGAEAFAAARRTEDPSQRDDEFGALAQAFAKAGQARDAREAVRAISPPARDNALAAVAGELAEAGHLAEAEAAGREIRDPDNQALALRGVAAGLAAAGEIVQAYRIAHQVAGSRFGASAATAVAEAMVKAGRLDEAYLVARRIDRSEEQAEALRAVVEGLVAHGRMPQALVVCREIPDPAEQANAFAAVAGALARAGRVSEARTLTGEMRDLGAGLPYPYSTGGEGIIAAALAEAGHVVDGLAMAGEVKNAYRRGTILVHVAETLLESGRRADALPALRAARAAAGQIARPQSRAGILRRVADGFLTAGQWAEAVAVLDESRQAAQAIHDQQDYEARIFALTETVQRLARAGALREAHEIALGMPEPASSSALRVLAQELARTGRIDAATSVAREIVYAHEHAVALAAIAGALAATGRISGAKAVALTGDSVARTAETTEARGVAFPSVAKALAAAHLYRRAFELASRGEVSLDDRLSVYTMIVQVYDQATRHSRTGIPQFTTR